MAFLGYQIPEVAVAGGNAEIWLAWEVRHALPQGVSYHFFTHLVDEDAATKRAQHDTAPFPTALWHPGDVIFSRFPIPIPADVPPKKYGILAGMYTYPDVVGVSFLDVAGNPAGTYLRLGEITVSR